MARSTQELRAGGMERATALQVFPYLTADEQLQAFPDLVFLASSAHGSLGVVRNAILALPRDYVLNNVEKEAEGYLRDVTYDEFRRFLELFWLLDRGMTRRLAERAAGQIDADIREAGVDFLEKLSADE